VYYSLERCSDGSVGFRTGQQIGDISLSVNDRVEVSSLFYIVTGTTTSGTSVGTVTDTGLTGCPVVTTSTTTSSTTTTSTTTPTTTSTTVVSYNYYTVRGCPDSTYENLDLRIRTTSTFTQANGFPSTSNTITHLGSSFYGYSTIDEATWLVDADLQSITYTGSVGVGCPVATTTSTTVAATTTTQPVTTQAPTTTTTSTTSVPTTSTTAAPTTTTSAPTTQPPATTTTQPVTTQAPTTTTVAPTTAAPTTTSTTAAATTTTTSTTAPPATTTTQAPVTTTTAAPTTVAPTTTTTTIVTYAGARTSGQSTSDDACNLFAFNNVWFATPTPEDGARVYTDSTAQTPFNGGDQWYGIDMDGNGVSFSTRITSFGYMYSTTECLGGGGF
jgi:hypothetical protein